MNDQAQALRNRYRENVEINDFNQTRVIAVASGKGGVGKSSIALNLGIDLAQKGKQVYLIDGDMGMANLDILLGICPDYTLAHVMMGQKEIDEIVLDGPCGLKLIAGGSGFYDMANLSKWRLQQFVLRLRAIAECADFLIIDTGAGISETVISLVLAAGHVLVVTTPEPTAITDAYGVIKVLISYERKMLLDLVVNMALNNEEALLTAEKLKTVTKQFLNIDIDMLGYVVKDKRVGDSVNNQDPFILRYPNSGPSKCIKSICNNLLQSYSTSRPLCHSRGTLRSFIRNISAIFLKKV